MIVSIRPSTLCGETRDDAKILHEGGQVTRLLRRLHAHGPVAKIPHSRRWRVSLAGRRTMTTAIKLREVAYPSLFAAAA
jgi:hypothetical protein